MDMSPMALWNQMGILVKIIMVLLLFLSVYSLGLSVERWWTFSKAKTQSVRFALEVDRPQAGEARSHDLAKKYKNSHVAKVVSAGLLEFAYEAHGSPWLGHDVVAAAERAIERTTMMTTADLKKGLGGLATIATTAPFIGLLTVIGIINAFTAWRRPARAASARFRRYRQAFVGTAIGLWVAIPAVWLYNYFPEQDRPLPGGDVELGLRARRLTS
jgi:biopolymer transport protein ExbB/biopolymer transport protein TolQ